MHYARLMSCIRLTIVLDIVHAFSAVKDSILLSNCYFCDIIRIWTVCYYHGGYFRILKTVGCFFLSSLLFWFLLSLELFYCWIAFRSICSVAVIDRHHWETPCHQSLYEVHQKSSAAAERRDWYITVFCYLDLKQKESTGYYRDVSNTKNILSALFPLCIKYIFSPRGTVHTFWDTCFTLPC